MSKITLEEREQIALEFRVAAQEAGHLLLRWGLSNIRRTHGLTVEQVAERMGYDPDDVVREIESAGSDPRLSTLRRYALAVGARTGFEVLEVIPEPEADA